MKQVFPAKYTDQNGVEITTIRNDGKFLRMNVRGVEFSGDQFDGFEPEKNTPEEKLAVFSLDSSSDLCECMIECEIPLEIIAGKSGLEAKLLMKLGLGKVSEKGWIEEEELFLTLKYQGFEFHSKGASGWFEDELIDLEKQLPEGHRLKCCFGCNYSDYSVYGHSLFGDMRCYRNIKDKYRGVLNKFDFIKIMDQHEEEVQETYLCPEFEIRKAGTGYRG